MNNDSSSTDPAMACRRRRSRQVILRNRPRMLPIDCSRVTQTAFWRGWIIVAAAAITLLNIPVARASACTDTWVATATTGAPIGRYEHTAIWTGSEMIVWGGFDQVAYTWLKSGGRYKPATNSWMATNVS